MRQCSAKRRLFPYSIASASNIKNEVLRYNRNRLSKQPLLQRTKAQRMLCWQGQIMSFHINGKKCYCASFALLAVMTIASTLMGGCGSGNKTVSPQESTTVSSTESVDGLTLTLSADRSSISVGQSVNYTLTVTNTSKSPVIYYPGYSGGLPAIITGTYSFVTITRSDAATPVQIPADSTGTTGLSSIEGPSTLGPGATLTGKIAVGSAITQSGVYSTTATLSISVADPLEPDITPPSFQTTLSAGTLTLKVH